MKTAFLLFLLSCIALAHPQQKPSTAKPPVAADLVGSWTAYFLIDEKKLSMQPEQFQKAMRTQVEKMQKAPWVLTLKKDGVFVLALAKGQSQEGVWASKESLLHVRVKKESGNKSAVDRLERFAIATDRKSFRTRLTPYLVVEYMRK